MNLILSTIQQIKISHTNHEYFFFRQQQLSLWCPLLGIILILALFIWFCRTDEACCDVEKPCLYRCGCKKYRKDE